MATTREHVSVHLDARELGPRREVAMLARERDRAQSVVSFSYDAAWAQGEAAFPLDPTLPLFEGEQFPRGLPGILSDAAPDRWGRTLMERREAAEAHRAERRPRNLDDWDFLLGVSDVTRMGALRFAREGGGFVDGRPFAVPPIARLRELEHWASELEHGLSEEMSEEERWIAMLVAPGSSLGGARPKAVFADEGDLWIAKFPSREDRHDVGAWEYALSTLAVRAGIVVPEARLLRLGSPLHTFCVKRFDRVGDARRLYASAMTLSGRSDHDTATYLDIALAIAEHGDPEAIEADLQQLFRRLVFNVLCGNRDDHLRNHGFLRTPGGWRLAPAFDVNPEPSRLEHSLAIDDSIRLPDMDAVRQTATYYRLSIDAAEEIVADVRRAVSSWPEVAREIGLGVEEIDRVGNAFSSA